MNGASVLLRRIPGWHVRAGLLICLLCNSLGCATREFSPVQSEAGMLDLSGWIPAEHGMVSLDGQWAFYPEEFVPASDIKAGLRMPEHFLEVPGIWDNLEIPTNDGGTALAGACLFGTYQLNVRLPAASGILALRIQSALSAYDLWIDDRLAASVGQPGESEAATRPLYIPKSVLFSPESQTVSIVVHIANFHHRDGGLYRPVLLGSDEQLIAHERRSSMVDMFVLASISVMAGYHLIHFGYRREETTSLYFALGCIAVMIWHASNNEHLLRDFLPALSGPIGLRVDYCSFFASVAFFSLFIRAMFPEFYPRSLVRIVIAVSILAGLAVLTQSMLSASQVIPIFQMFTAVASLATISFLVRAFWCGAPLAGYILLGLMVFVATFLNDFLYSNGWIRTAWLSPFGLVYLVVVTSMTISVRFKKSFNHVSQLKSTFERFVPKRFLSRITDEDLSDIQLGNAQGESIVVLFSDIRGFTTTSEQLSPADLLQYLNLYFFEMATVVKRNGGFIDKFIGDGVMALFDEDQSSQAGDASRRALTAAVQMQEALPGLNAELKQRGWPAIQVGIGIHFGPVVMGTVGAEFRMDSTVLGDTVNTAARLEGLAKQYQEPIVISRALLDQIPADQRTAVREIGTVGIRGKLQPMQVFAVPIPT